MSENIVKDDEIKELAEDIQPEQPEQPTEEKISVEEQLQSIQIQLDSIVSRLNDTDDYLPSIDENELTERENALFQRQIQLELKAESLEEFADFIHAENEEELLAQIGKLKKLKGKLKAENGYKPSEHNASSDYAKALKNRDVKSMIRTKF